MAQVPTLARMLVFMVGSSGVLVLLSGHHAPVCADAAMGAKAPREAGADTEEGAAPSRPMRVQCLWNAQSSSTGQRQQTNELAQTCTSMHRHSLLINSLFDV